VSTNFHETPLSAIVSKIQPAIVNADSGLRLGFLPDWGSTNQVRAVSQRGKLLEMEEVVTIKAITSPDRRPRFLIVLARMGFT
jgi:hypothetical protein